MHEIGLCEGILETVQARALGRRVSQIRVRAGVRHGVDTECMQQAFTVVADGTEAADAIVELVCVPAELRCHACGHVAVTSDVISACPRCHSGDVAILGGDELTLESIGYAAPVAT